MTFKRLVASLWLVIIVLFFCALPLFNREVAIFYVVLGGIFFTVWAVVTVSSRD